MIECHSAEYEPTCWQIKHWLREDLKRHSISDAISKDNSPKFKDASSRKRRHKKNLICSRLPGKAPSV